MNYLPDAEKTKYHDDKHLGDNLPYGHGQGHPIKGGKICTVAQNLLRSSGL
jgi:hypothetical protein